MELCSYDHFVVFHVGWPNSFSHLFFTHVFVEEIVALRDSPVESAQSPNAAQPKELHQSLFAYAVCVYKIPSVGVA